MFFKKKPVILWMITITNDKASVLYQGPLYNMQFAQCIVKELSMEFFRDPEPCHIHRSAVIQRAMMEIELTCPEGMPVHISDLSPRITSFFSCYENAHSLTLQQEEIRS